MTDKLLRQEIIATALAFNETGLSVGTSGNLSARTSQGFIITPTGISYESLSPNELVGMNLEGEIISGELIPSSEWPFHKAIYWARDTINAVVHVHSTYATGVACTRQGIPAFHYMVAIVGGDSIRCAPYATFGTEELSKNAVTALRDRKACLLANHGLIAIGENVQSAFKMAQEVENLAKQYWISKQFAEPVILDNAEMTLNLGKFKSYGNQDN